MWHRYEELAVVQRVAIELDHVICSLPGQLVHQSLVRGHVGVQNAFDDERPHSPLVRRGQRGQQLRVRQQQERHVAARQRGHGRGSGVAAPWKHRSRMVRAPKPVVVLQNGLVAELDGELCPEVDLASGGPST